MSETARASAHGTSESADNSLWQLVTRSIQGISFANPRRCSGRSAFRFCSRSAWASRSAASRRTSFTSRSRDGYRDATTLADALKRDSGLAVELLPPDSAMVALRTGRVALVVDAGFDRRRALSVRRHASRCAHRATAS